ncbi:MAG: SIS domain-containing protein [Rhodothermales bacterium]
MRTASSSARAGRRGTPASWANTSSSAGRIPVEVEYASELRYRDPILRQGDIVLVISQSGETADTLAAVRERSPEGRPGARDLQRGRLDHRARDGRRCVPPCGAKSAWRRRRRSPRRCSC